MNRIRVLSRVRLLAVSLACMLGLSACGFHLKGATPLPFRTIYTNINLDTDFGARLKRTTESNSPDTRFVATLSQADVYLHQVSESQNMRQISIDPDGRVEEYELDLDFTFELLDRTGHVLLAPTTLRSVREIPYNDRIVQAKESEIVRTFRNMRNGLVDRILRRLSAPDVQSAYRNAVQQPNVPVPQATTRPPASTVPVPSPLPGQLAPMAPGMSY